MIKKTKLYLSSALSTIAILGSFQSVEAANITWDSSTSSNMFDATNWTPATIPTTGDNAQFGAGTSVTPFLNAGNAITTDTVTITSPSARQFAIQGTGTALTLGTATVGTGVNNTGGGATLQEFNISDGAMIHFVDSGSARVSGPVTYNVTNPLNLGTSQLLFSNSTKAGNGYIGLTPQPAILNVSNPLSTLTFQNNADANTAVITASNGGNVFFNSTFSNTNAKITLNSGSHLFVAQNTAIDNLQSTDSSTTAELQNGAALTVGSEDSLITLFPGSITEVSGSSAFVKRGDDIVVITNGSNNYSGGTTVQNGTLVVTPSSLPVAAVSPSVTIFPLQPMEIIPPTLSFGLVGVSTVYSGDILNDGAIGVSAPAGDLNILELSGDISGSGIILVSDNGDLTLSGTNNTYSGETIISGVVNTTAANLPVGADVVMFQQTPTSPIPVLNFTTTGTETFSGSITNLDPNIPGGFVTLSESGHLTFTGSNNYDQGTYIIDGWLTGDTDSIPVAASGPSVTVAFDGIIEFNQTVPGIFAGEISLLNAAAILRSSGPANLEISESITGIGRLEVNAGQLTLSGVNTYSGGSTVAPGATLIGNSSSLQNSIANGGSVIFEQNSNGIFNGSFSGAGTIEKNGLGILSFATPSPTFSGTTNVNAGTFKLNTLLGGDVNVYAARISGNGTVGRNLTLQNGSVIAPGNSIGTIVVNGDFSMTSADVYEVEVDGDGNSDLIDVRNNATLAGTVAAVSIDGGYSNEEYLIMNIEGTRTGEFDNLVTLSSRVLGALRYVDDPGSSQVYLSLQSIFNLYAETYNQLQVSNQLATITNPSPELDLILNELEILGSSPDTVDQVRLAYDQMSGVQYAHIALVSEISGNQFLRRLYDPIRSTVTKRQCLNLCCEEALDVWFEAGGGRMNIDGSRNVRGFDVNSYQLSGGVQTEIQSDVIVGLAGSYANDQLDYRKLDGHGTCHTGFAGLYGLYRPTCGYVFVDAIYGYTDNKMKRRINIGPLEYLARSKPKISQARGYIEAGYDLDSCFCSDILIQPFVGLEVRNFRRNHVSERGAYPLNLCIASKRKTDALSRLGVHVTANELFCHSFLSLDLAWQYRFTNPCNTLRERFQSFGDEFKIKGRDLGRNSVDAALTFSTSLGNNWELYVEAIGEVWSNTCAYNFLGGVQYSW